MLALTYTCEVPVHRLITLQLPDSIEPGRHQITLVVNEQEPALVTSQPASQTAASEFATKRMAALEQARAQLGGLLSSSDEFAARKREEIELEERKFAR